MSPRRGRLVSFVVTYLHTGVPHGHQVLTLRDRSCWSRWLPCWSGPASGRTTGSPGISRWRRSSSAVPILIYALPALPVHPAHLHAHLASRRHSDGRRALHLRARCRSASGSRTRSASPGTTTTGSGTSRRDSCRRCWRARSSSADPRCGEAAGCRSWSCASAWPSARLRADRVLDRARDGRGARRISWAPRATCGTRSGTCSWR